MYFLKGLGLSMEECLIVWRQSFKLINDETLNKQSRYNVRHAYGDVGGDATRRGRGYAPFSCQRIFTEDPLGSGESHRCPCRHFSLENLTNLTNLHKGPGLPIARCCMGSRETWRRNDTTSLVTGYSNKQTRGPLRR